MTLTIITINRNNATGLETTLNSVAQQDCSPTEYIVIDGASTDNSIDVIKRNAAFITFWVSEPDSGIYNAMNKGVAQAGSDYCLFVNSGDKLHDNHVVARIMHAIASGEMDYYVGDTLFVSFGCKREVIRSPRELTMHYLLSSYLSHPASVIRTSILRERPFNESLRIVADWEQMIYAFFFGNASYCRLDYVVSDFDLSGISAIQQEISMRERETAITQLFPGNVGVYMNMFDITAEERRRRIKIEKAFNMGGVSGSLKIVRNSLKWLLIECWRYCFHNTKCDSLNEYDE